MQENRSSHVLRILRQPTLTQVLVRVPRLVAAAVGVLGVLAVALALSRGGITTCLGGIDTVPDKSLRYGASFVLKGPGATSGAEARQGPVLAGPQYGQLVVLWRISCGTCSSSRSTMSIELQRWIPCNSGDDWGMDRIEVPGGKGAAAGRTAVRMPPGARWYVRVNPRLPPGSTWTVRTVSARP